MKKALMVLAVLAVASSAMAISLSPVPFVTGQTASEARALTPDGSALVGTSGTVGAFWPLTKSGTNVSVGSGTAIVSSAAWAFTSASGVGIRTVNGQPQYVAHGMSSGWTCSAVSNDGVTWTSAYRAGDSSGIGVANTLAVIPGTDAYYTASWTNDTNATPVLYVEKIAGTTPALVTRDTKGTTTSKSSLRGVSTTGLAVGFRKSDGTNQCNYKGQYDGDGGLSATTNWTGLDGTIKGEAWAIAGNGTKIFGRSPATGKTGFWPYVYDVATGVTTALPTANPSATNASNGIVYGASYDGRYAVGMDYTAAGMEKAVLWDLQAGTVTDLTTWATNNGILGAFTGNLRRAYSVGVAGDGTVIISGYGYASSLSTGWTGFVLALPEPSTMLFLAIGGVALLRRRR